MNTLTDLAPEEGTYPIIVTFSGIPNSVTWKLTDQYANVINSRTAESEVAGLSVNIVLSGDDLALPDSNETLRIVTVWGTFDSISYGNNLPYVEEIGFNIENFIAID